MAIKVQYVASDNKAFDSIEEAKEYEKELERANGAKHSYHVTLFIECSCHVEAFDEEEAAEIAQDHWFAGGLKCEEEVIDVRAFEE